MREPEYPGQPVTGPAVGPWMRLRLLLSQVGGSRHRKHAFDMLICVGDLPGPGWQELNRHSRRVGAAESGPIARRARETGEFTALRRFRHEDPPGGMMAQVLPLATSSDAEKQVVAFPSTGIRWQGVTTVEDHFLDDVQVEGVDQLIAWESVTERDDVRGTSRKIAGRVGRVTFLVTASAAGPGWPLVDLVAIASSQATRIRLVLEDPPQGGPLTFGDRPHGTSRS